MGNYYYYEDGEEVWGFAKKTVEVAIAIDIDEIAKHICTRGKTVETLVPEVMAVAIAAAEKGLGKETSREVCLKKWQASATYKADAPDACNNACEVATALLNRGNEQWKGEAA